MKDFEIFDLNNLSVRTKNIIFCTFSTLILFLGFWTNSPLYLSENGVYNFDSTSNNIMISDLMYRQNFGVNGLFLKSITYQQLISEYKDLGSPKDIVLNMFNNNQTFPKEEFIPYTSNITMHRYVYAFFDNILPVSNKTLINLFEIINCLLMAIVITILLLWIKSKTNFIVSYIMAFILALFSPLFTMYPKNLYWVSWTLFLPITLTILLISTRLFNKISENKKCVYLLILSFVACFIKQLIYFEFVTTVMISMMVPIVYYILERKTSFKSGVKLFAFPVIGALISFISANLIKFFMLSAEFGGSTKALDIIITNFNARVTGNNVSEDLISSSKASFTQVIWDMNFKTAFSINSVLFISQFMIVLCIFGLTVIQIFQFLKNREAFIKINPTPLLASVWISLSAPLSWFILAKPHTFVHDLHCSITWFIPFTILGTAYILNYFTQLIKLQFERKECKNELP